MNRNQLIAHDCREYAKRHNCDLATALTDWEGDGPSGSWGLNRDEEYAVAVELGIGEQFAPCDEY
jgi:hypothetical protein